MIEISLKKKKNEEFAKELNERRKQASITIQKNARGRITRNNLNEKKRKQKEREIYAAIQIQKQGRGMLSRKHVKEKQQKILLDLCIEEDDDEKTCLNSVEIREDLPDEKRAIEDYIEVHQKVKEDGDGEEELGGPVDEEPLELNKKQSGSSCKRKDYFKPSDIQNQYCKLDRTRRSERTET